MNRTLVVTYLLISCYFLVNWLKFNQQRPSYTPEDKFLSFVVLIITTTLWPLAFVINCINSLKTRKLELNSIVTVGMISLGIIFYYFLNFNYS